MPSKQGHSYQIYRNLFSVWVWCSVPSPPTPQLKQEVHNVFFQHLGTDRRTSAEFTY